MKTIYFIGADGSGKSSLIDKIQKSDQSKFVKIHFAPGIIKFKKNHNEHNINNKIQSPRSSIISLIRLLLWIINIKFFELIKLKSKKIFLFDRGIYDILVDPKRYRYSLPKNITKFFLKFIKKPNYIIFLYGNSELIFSRKNEKSSEEIHEVNQKYIRFLNDYENSTTFDISDSLETNFAKAMNIINTVDNI
tara:strand:+ start:1604 stop:2179 length:576 start_codon:yes stop_codon:yes gene_type:complete